MAKSTGAAQGAGGNFGDTPGRLGEEMKDRVRGVSDEVRKGAERASAEIRRGYERASEVAREGYEDAARTARQGYQRMRKDLGGLSEDVNAYVRDNPGKSVLIAAGAGFLLGLLFRFGDEE